MAKRPVPDIPYKVPMLNAQGFLNAAWQKWFRDVFVRIGGSLALTNVELEQQTNADIVVLQTDVAALQSSDTTQNATLTSLQSQIDDIKKGREVFL